LCSARIPDLEGLYNYFRDYDPAVGRYIESDPIGLNGGINTYSYAYSNPLSWSDPQGTRPPSSSVPGISIPWPVPPIVIPGTPENNAWVQSAYRQIGDAVNAIAQACSTKEPDCVRASAFHLANAGITDAEKFKAEYVGNAGGKFDICACKDGSISLAAVGQCGRSGPKIGTGLTWKK
jgi:RHS repeat-associated protein